MPTIHPQLRDSELRGLNKELERQGRKESEAGKWTRLHTDARPSSDPP